MLVVGLRVATVQSILMFDLLVTFEHRLALARVFTECAKLGTAGHHSVWVSASQESSHVAHAGVGVVGACCG